jgi:hypothetical protein
LKDKGVYYFKVSSNGSNLSVKVTIVGSNNVLVIIDPMKPIKIPDDSPFIDPDMQGSVM